MKKQKIGFIGQGWIGKNYADNFEDRGYQVTRYAKEPKYIKNKNKIKNCDIVFVAVPTPTCENKFDCSILEQALSIVGEGKIAIIKSTIVPGTTEKLQKKYPKKIILHSPEFLTEATARYDANHPKRNIIGYVDKKGKTAANKVMKVLPKAPYKSIIPVKAAELVKYTGNCFLYLKVIYINLIYDLAKKMDIDYEIVREAISHDPRIGFSHLDPIHKAGRGKKGRGAGSNCFIKDFAAFIQMYKKLNPKDKKGYDFLEKTQEKNIELLLQSKKDLELLKGVYGKDIIKK